jgi:hypothetical protein
MHNLIKIDSVDSMARDTMTHAVLQTDESKITEYRNRKAYAQSNAMMLQQQQDEINLVKNDINEIKNMLMSMIQRQSCV